MRLTKEYLQKYNHPDNFYSRDLNWLEFNRKVLEEAINPELPLLVQSVFLHSVSLQE